MKVLNITKYAEVNYYSKYFKSQVKAISGDDDAHNDFRDYFQEERF